MSQVHVLFHKHCFDGTGAKYAAWKKFGESAIYTPVQYGEPVPETVLDGSEVYILDFSYPKDVLEQLRLRSKSILVLDHHKTAKEALEGLPYAQFDMDRSGAVMAWQHFHPEDPVPNLLLDVQDGDLWKWERDNTGAIRAALPLLKGDMGRWEHVAESSYDGADPEWSDYHWLIGKGATKLEFDEISIESSVAHIHEFTLNHQGDRFKAAAVNVHTLASEVGNALCQKGYDIAVPYFISEKGHLVLSFRSKAGGDVDVSAIAKSLGGGGHKSAAAARTSISVLEYLYKATLEHPLVISANEKATLISTNGIFTPILTIPKSSPSK